MIAAVVLGLYVVYQLSWTNVQSSLVASSISSELRQRFEAQDKGEPREVANESVAEDFGAYALIYIPALGDDVMGLPVMRGTSDAQLAAGIGQYESSEEPGEIGNLTLAGHRATNGEPFARFELLSAGDLVYIQTAEGWYVYELFADQKVRDTEVWTISDAPAGQQVWDERLITLTTCDPRWNSTQRWVRWGTLVEFSIDNPMPGARL